MRKYSTVFFDLDHTLWDYDKNSSETLTELYYEYGFDSRKKVSLQGFLNTFNEVNQKLWANYNKGHINREDIRNQRFKKIFKKFGIRHDPLALDISDEYIKRCPTKTNLMPHALSILDYLEPNYTLCLLTNGFNDVQSVKLSSSGLKTYFKYVITSESSGHRKPSREIFQYSLALTKASAKRTIMIGDNLNADIYGAKRAEIDQVYFNPSKEGHNQPVTHEIDCLSQLSQIL
ncbi:MAG: YjjG family noncanonical pyrimidine nucleotidase [Bacteroidota bacterium]